MVLLSYCISIMNRLYQIKKTLRVNIDNSTDKSEFIIIDYNSNDGLKKYIYDNFEDEISNGKLKYYFTDKIKLWHASICKNTTHMKANGKYLVNLDCDNFIGKNGDNIIISQTNNIQSSGNGGRITLTKKKFIKLDGYNESFYSMGYQDYDLIERAKKFCNIYKIRIIQKEGFDYGNIKTLKKLKEFEDKCLKLPLPLKQPILISRNINI